MMGVLNQRTQDRIMNQKHVFKDLIRFYEDGIKISNKLQMYGNFSHGLGNLRYTLEYNTTVLYLKCNDNQLIIRANNMAVIANTLYMGGFGPLERIQKLKQISVECSEIIDELNIKYKN